MKLLGFVNEVPALQTAADERLKQQEESEPQVPQEDCWQGLGRGFPEMILKRFVLNRRHMVQR